MTSSPALSSSKQRRRSSPRHRTALLVGTLLGLTLLLPLSRHYLLSKPAPPSASAGIRVNMRYYAGRIKQDPSDVAAYVALGRLDAMTGYYTDALKHLYAARALGAKDQETAVPLGHALTYLAHYAEARAELQKAVRLMPDNLLAAVDLAELCLADNKPQEASQALRAYVARNPDVEMGTAPTAKNDVERLLHYFLQAGDEEMGGKMAEDLIRIAPDQPAGYALSGKILLARNEPKKALERLQKVSQMEPDDAVSQYMVGVALAKTGREEEALKQWQKTVALNPQAKDAYYYMAETYAKRKDYKRAAIAMQILSLNDSTNKGLIHSTASACDKSGEKIAAAYWHSIDSQLQKNYPAALNYARQVTQDPAWHNRGMAMIAQAYRGMNRMDDYLAVTRQLASHHNAEEDITLANAYGAAEHLEDQRQTLKTALAEHPKDPAKVHILLSEVALKKGLREEAETELEQAIALDPKKSLYHRDLGNLYYERRSQGDRLQRAIREFEQVVRLDPDEVTGYQMLGMAQAAAGDLHRGAINLEHSLDLLPGDGVTYQELGRIYARLGDKAGSDEMMRLYRMYVSYDLKQKTLQAASRSAQKDPDAQIALADFLERSGDYPGAARYYHLASVLRPTDATLKAKIEHVRALQGQANN